MTHKAETASDYSDKQRRLEHIRSLMDSDEVDLKLTLKLPHAALAMPFSDLVVLKHYKELRGQYVSFMMQYIKDHLPLPCVGSYGVQLALCESTDETIGLFDIGRVLSPLTFYQNEALYTKVFYRTSLAKVALCTGARDDIIKTASRTALKSIKLEKDNLKYKLKETKRD
jgi:hypothetical protein